MVELVAAVIGDHSQLNGKWSVQKASSKTVQPAVWLLFPLVRLSQNGKCSSMRDAYNLTWG